MPWLTVLDDAELARTERELCDLWVEATQQGCFGLAAMWASHLANARAELFCRAGLSPVFLEVDDEG